MKTFSQFIAESAVLKAELESHANQVKGEHGVDLDVFHGNDDTIHVSRIVVPKDKRGTGVGSKVMQGVTAIADRHGKRTVLTPATDFGGSSVKRLTGFYKGHGFVENKGRNKDYSTRETMYRDPK
jgi:GNAT superfamily N-acetyltransferase